MKQELEHGQHRAADYRAYLEAAYQEEVYGEALFRTMARLCEEPERARKLRVLEQLERETKELLRRAVRELGGRGEASAEKVADGERSGRQLAGMPWDQVMRGFQEELAEYLAELERAEALAPPGQERLGRHVTAHERALVEFATRELRGRESGDPLEPVVALLRASPVS